MIFLDTHVVVWLYAGQLEKFSNTARRLLEEQELSLSPAVELELEFLHEIKRIKKRSSEIIQEIDAHLGLKISTIDFYRVVEEAKSIKWTRDPFDRLIVANASIFQLPLLTKDNVILKHYALAKW